MATSPSTRRDPKVVRNLISHADMVLDLPQPAIRSTRESVKATLALAADLIKRSMPNPVDGSAAAALGARGGTKTAERGRVLLKNCHADEPEGRKAANKNNLTVIWFIVNLGSTVN